MRWSLPVLAILFIAAAGRADDFDHYINTVLTKAPESKNVKETRELTPTLLADHARVLPKIDASVIVVKTNQARYAKLLVRSGRQKLGENKTVPILYIERYVTYKEGEERQVVATGQNVTLFPGFRLSLDLGQIVPDELGGDIRLVQDGNKVFTEPVNKASMWVLTTPMPEAKPAKGTKLVVGETFEPRYFNGKFKLYDDGRRSGELTLKVDEEGKVSGSYVSDKDGAKYEVNGTIGKPQHSIQFTIKFPRSEQTFSGMLFTGDGKAMTGTSKIIEREAGFYAVRVED